MRMSSWEQVLGSLRNPSKAYRAATPSNPLRQQVPHLLALRARIKSFPDGKSLRNRIVDISYPDYC